MTSETKRTPRSAGSGQNVPIKRAAVAEFRPQSGAMALFLRGKLTPSVVVDVDENTPAAEIAAMAQAGVIMFRLRRIAPGWTGPNKYDFAQLDRRVQHIMANAPDANLILEVEVDAPDWWRSAHKGECAVFCLSEAAAAKQGKSYAEAPAALEIAENGEQAQADADASTQAKSERKTVGQAKSGQAEPESELVGATLTCASWASRRWLNEAGDALAHLVRHVGQSAWGERCIGYQVVCGEAGEWRHEGWQRMPDVGARMAERFRNFCVDKYRRNTGLLRKGWDDPRADFDRIACPNAYERRYADLGILRDPLRSRRMLDYFECFYGAQNEAALHFCGIIKRVAQDRAVVGLAYAAPFGASASAEGMHGLPETVFDSPDVDFFVDTAGGHDHLYSSAFAGSLSLRDKFLFHAASEARPLLQDAGIAQTVGAGLLLAASASPDEIRAILKMGEWALLPAPGGNKRPAQIAVIADPVGPVYLAGKEEARAEWNRAIFEEQPRELAQMGAPFDAYLLSDLFHPKFRDYKVYVFLNTFYLSEAERRRVEARVKRSEQTAVWLWGAGILTETGVEAEAGEKLIGSKLRMEKKETSLRVRIVEGNDPLTWGFHVGAKFGPEQAVMPSLTVNDKTTTRLGANTDNKTVFSVRRDPTWTSVHFGTLPVPATLLRNVLKGAGVHLYADTAGTAERVAAGARCVVVNSKHGGTVKVFLPAPHEITNALNPQKPEIGSETALTLKPGETRILAIKALPKKKEIVAALTEIADDAPRSTPPAAKKVVRKRSASRK